MALGFAGLCITFASIPLPETQGEPLPQSLADMKKMKWKTKKDGCRLLKRKAEKEEKEEEEEQQKELGGV